MSLERVAFGILGSVFRTSATCLNSLGFSFREDEVLRDRALNQSFVEAQMDLYRVSADLKSTKMTGKQQHMRPILSSANLILQRSVFSLATERQPKVFLRKCYDRNRLPRGYMMKLVRFEILKSSYSSGNGKYTCPSCSQ